MVIGSRYQGIGRSGSFAEGREIRSKHRHYASAVYCRLHGHNCLASVFSDLAAVCLLLPGVFDTLRFRCSGYSR